MTRNSPGDEIGLPECPERDIGSYTPLASNVPDGGIPLTLGTISVKFCTEVKGCLRCKMAKKYCRKFQPLE